MSWGKKKEPDNVPAVWICDPCKRGRHDMCLKKNEKTQKSCICQFVRHDIQPI